MNALKKLFEQMFSKERRKAERLPANELAAFYWTGAAPAEHGIRDISSTGLYLVTEERWYPGTLVMMTLQKKNGPEEPSARSIAVQSKAVRWGSDGVGLEFILPDGKGRQHGRNADSDGVDRRSLEKFLNGFRADNGSTIVDSVVPPSNGIKDADLAKS